MGLADLILGKTNPFAAFVDQNHNSIRGAGAQFAQGTSLGGALSGAAQGYAQGAPVDDAYAIQQKAEQERLDGIKQTAAWLKQNYPQFASLPPEQGFDIASKIAAQKASPGANDPADVATYKFYAGQELAANRQPKSFAEWFAGSKQAAKGSLGQTLPFYDPQKKQWHPVQQFTDGSLVDTLTGKAPDPSLNYDPVGFSGDKAGATTFGGQQAGVQFNIPAAKQNVDAELANIDAIINDKTGGLDQKFGNVGGLNIGGVGFPNQWTPTIPNSPRAGVEARINQVVGENFLQAYSSLKGAGAITEVEGGKAQDAMARLSAAQSKTDFITALNDLKDVLKTGYARIGQQAGSQYDPNGFTPPPLSGGSDPVAAANALLQSGKY